MKLPAELLRKQFPSKLVRGAIVRFEFQAFADPKRTGPGPKFAIVLNRADVQDPVYLALTTSKVEPYDKTTQFDGVVMKFAAGEYGCWPLRTVVALRDNPTEASRTRLEQQFVDGRLSFVGSLTAPHLARLDGIIQTCPFISPNLRQFLLP